MAVTYELQAVALDRVHVERGAAGQDLAAAAHRALPGTARHRRLNELPGGRHRPRGLLPRCRGSRPAASQPPAPSRVNELGWLLEAGLKLQPSIAPYL